MIRPNRFKTFHHALIKAVTCDRGAIADDDQLAAGAGEGHIQAARDGCADVCQQAFHQADIKSSLTASVEMTVGGS